MHEGLLHNFNKNDFSTHDKNGIKPNLITNISNLEKRKKFKGSKFFLKPRAGAVDGHSIEGGGGTQTDNKAKPSSAKKPNLRKKFNLNPSNYKPITNYFKPAIKSELGPTSKTENTEGEGGKK